MSKYFYKYVNGDKWIQINGKGNDPKNCKISWESSKNNDDMIIVEMNKMGRSPLYDWIKFDDSEYINNIYAQVLKITPVIKDGYICKKYDVPEIKPLLPDPQIIIPEKEDEIETEKISINKSELSKAVNVGSQSGEVGFALVPRSHDKKNLEFENKVVSDLDNWIRDREQNLKDELKRFYEDLDY